MAEKMLIDASHPEETRVVVVRGNRIEEFDFESQHKKQLRGNIYLAKVTRVEPSLQAAFVDYGGNRHGFLAFSEIHPDYYQIPLADRQALLEAEAEEAESAARDVELKEETATEDQPLDAENKEEASEEKKSKPKRRRTRRKKADSKKEVTEAEGTEAKADDDKDVSQDATVETPEEISTAPEIDEEAQNAIETASGPSKSSEQVEDEKEVSESIEPETSDTEKKNDDPDIMAAIVETDDEISEEVDISASDDNSDDTSVQKIEPEQPEQPSEDEVGETDASAVSEEEPSEINPDEDSEDQNSNSEDNETDTEDESVEEVGASDVSDEVPETPRKTRKQYRIQEVIKRRQILLVQIVKEERGNKGAALTTYMSLAGRYSVLMPNTARGGGISRKITNTQDRKRLKEIAQELEVPNGMGVILRTAGASRTKTEIRRDFEYLMRLWENVRELTLSSMAPCLVYEEGSLIKRSVRDLYNKDIGEVIVSGEDGYREAKDFMKMLMPSHAKVVQPYRGSRPIFTNNGIEAQLDQMMSPQVTLKSGGYLIINQTEALVAVDVNSGRSTRESSIEDTALQTNLEAAEEVARQLKLRDLAGLVVIDFIDMEEKRNNRAVEKRLKECLKNDRARIQVGRISHFGLLEMSRQRIRASVLESTTQTCPHCEGTGLIRSDSSFALQILRAVEEQLLKNPRNDVIVRTTVANAMYILNNQRDAIAELETRFGISISIDVDHSLQGQLYNIQKGQINDRKAKAAPNSTVSSYGEADAKMDEDNANTDLETSEEDDGENDAPRKKRRRRRRRGRGNNDENRNMSDDNSTSDEESESVEANTDSAKEQVDETSHSDEDEDGRPKKRRRRGKRGGRKNRTKDQTDEIVLEENTSENPDLPEPAAASDVVSDEVKSDQPIETDVEAEPKAKKPRRRRKKQETTEAQEPSITKASDTPATEVALEAAKPVNREARTNLDAIATAPVVTSSTPEAGENNGPKRTGWWRRAFKN